MNFTPEQIQTYIDYAISLALQYAPKLVLAILTLVIGWISVKWVMRLIKRAFLKSNLEPSVAGFLESLIRIGLKMLLIIIFVSMLGVQTSSLVALVGAAGLAIGLALQGSLSNFAGGVLILIFKPFRIGDVIEAQGMIGTVSNIQVFNTTLKTGDSRTIIIPNGNLSNNPIINNTTSENRRIDLTIGIGYNDDIKKAKTVLKRIMEKEDRILSDPLPVIGVENLGESSVDLAFRVWVKNMDYWATKFDLLEEIKEQFEAEEISIPFPQRDVHHYDHKNY